MTIVVLEKFPRRAVRGNAGSDDVVIVAYRMALPAWWGRARPPPGADAQDQVAFMASPPQRRPPLSRRDDQRGDRDRWQIDPDIKTCRTSWPVSGWKLPSWGERHPGSPGRTQITIRSLIDGP